MVIYLPKPHLPRGMAFSCIGDGLSNPADFKPFRISSESNNLSKSTFSPIKTSPVLSLPVNLCAILTLIIDIITQMRVVDNSEVRVFVVTPCETRSLLEYKNDKIFW